MTVPELDALFAASGQPHPLVARAADAAIATLAQDLATVTRLIGDLPVHASTAALDDPALVAIRAAALRRWDDGGWRPFATLAGGEAIPARMFRLGEFADRGHTPALMPLFGNRGLALVATGGALDQARQAVATLLLRIVAGTAAGRVRLELIDHLNQGGAFTCLLNLHPALIGPMVWYQPVQIAEALARTVDQMAVITQKQLARHADIEAHNAEAGALVEPYRILAVADFPSGFDRTSAENLLSIARNGPRCGIYPVITVDSALPPPHGFKVAELLRAMNQVTADGDRFRVDHPILERHPIAFDPPPDRELVADVVKTMSAAAARLGPVKIDFDRFAPATRWSGSTADGVEVPVGQGKGKVQLFRLGQAQGTTHHALIAGKTGLGKTVLLHTLILQLALHYSPAELELYLVDFKVGVEFEIYRELPHVRVLAIESEREFGVSVLEGLRAELDRRGKLFPTLGVNALADYRLRTTEPLPRIIAIVDEFQLFFERNDRLAAQARALLDDIVRRGRGFGIHVVLSSQTVSPEDLEPSTLAQTGLRIALQLNEHDSYKVLARDNNAAALLERPGEAVYNDKDGLVGGNQQFQVAYVDPAQRRAHVEALAAAAAARPLVFDGHRRADLGSNRDLTALAAARPAQPPRATALFLGEPATLESRHTAFRLRRQSRSNLLIVGQTEAETLAVFLSAMASFLIAQPPHTARVELLGLLNVGEDGDLDDALEAFGGLAGVRLHGRRHVMSVIDAVHATMTERLTQHDDGRADRSPLILGLCGMQRARDLYREGITTPEPARKLSRILRDGADVGVHVILACDTFGGFLRCLEQKDLHEIDGRVALNGGDASRTFGDHGIGLHVKRNFGVLFESEAGDALRKFKLYDLASLIGWCRAHLPGKDDAHGSGPR